MNTMIKHFADALCAADAQPEGLYWEVLARASIEAMKNPSDDVVMACRDTLAYWSEDKDANDWRQIFNAQIDAALRGTTGEK